MALASAAGTAVVTALTTDLWERAGSATSALWKRVYPERADTVEADLLETRELLLAARERSEDGEQELEEGFTDEWRGRFRRLLAARPDLAQELREVLDNELTPALPAQGPNAGGVVFHAAPTGHARVYQAGRDQNITER